MEILRGGGPEILGTCAGGRGGLWKNDRVTCGAPNFFLDVNSVILTYER